MDLTFPELRPYLLEAFEQAEEGTEFVMRRYRDANANLRTQLQRIIGKADWKPGQNCFTTSALPARLSLRRRTPCTLFAHGLEIQRQ